MEQPQLSPPQNPAGELVREANLGAARRAELIEQVAGAPALLEQAVAGLDESQLDAKYRNWSIRQIVHHLADSHINSYIRFKWALTEDHPLIKAYDETAWSELPDAKLGPIAGALAMYAGVHQCWVDLMRRMTADQFRREFTHPETGKSVSLDEALSVYAWHSHHHTAQITWVRRQHGW